MSPLASVAAAGPGSLGAFAGMVLAMVFAYLSIYATLLGAVLNEELDKSRGQRAQGIGGAGSS